MEDVEDGVPPLDDGEPDDFVPLLGVVLPDDLAGAMGCGENKLIGESDMIVSSMEDGRSIAPCCHLKHVKVGKSVASLSSAFQEY